MIDDWVFDDDDPATCYHEAGHAVMAFALGGTIERLRLGGEADEFLPQRFGECRVRWDGFVAAGALPINSREAKTMMGCREAATMMGCRGAATALAGPVAELMHAGRDAAMEDLLPWREDLRVARANVSGMSGRVDPDAVLRALAASVRQFFSDNHRWAAVAALADDLSAHGEVDTDDIERVCGFWLNR